MVKQLLKTAALSLAFLGTLAQPFTTQAQDLQQKLSNDPSVKVGKLPNGLTYYIKPNHKPADKVELRLIINTGSILEDEDQLGLAHFTEHMLFNGTKSFPKNELVSKLQTMGVQFGADLNAYTSFDETVYMLPIPTDKPQNIEVGFQILKEWAQFANMTGKDIDEERKIILEEERTGKGASDRLQKKFLPKYLANSRYAVRLPIGKTELLKTFPHEAIRRYYKDWYRPNLMAVTVVGDITTEKAEELIKKYFSGLTNPKNERKREVFGMSPYEKNETMFLTDPEQTNTMMYFSFSATPDKPITTVGDYKDHLVENIVFTALNKRYEDLANSGNPPFIVAQLDNSSFVRGYKALGAVMIPSGDITTGINALVAELLSARQFGFNSDEIALAKKEMLSSMEKSYNERNTTNSSNFLHEYQDNFLNGNAFPGIEAEYELYKKFLPQITDEEVSKKLQEILGKADKQNYFAVIMSPEKHNDKINSDASLQTALNNAFQQKVEKKEVTKVDENLLDQEPKAGTILKVTEDKKLGTKTYELSNGILVTVKATDFKSDEVLIKGVKKGGTGNYGVADKMNVENLGEIIETMGYGKFTPTDLTKALTGKNISLVPDMGAAFNTVQGKSDVKNLETFFQLNYLQLTSPRLDESLINAYITKMKAQLKFAGMNPQIAFIKGMLADMYDNNPLRPSMIPSEEELDQINAKRAVEIYKNEFSNAKGFHFFIVGNVDEASLKPLLEKYVASLPTSGAEPNFKDNGLRKKAGNNIFEMKKGKEPKSLIIAQYFGELPFTEDLMLKSNLIADILTIRVIEKLREEMGAVYGAGFYGSFSKYPVAEYTIAAQIPTGPESVDAILKATAKEIEKLKTKGPELKDLEKAKIALVEKRKESMKTNDYWLNKLEQINMQGYSIDRFLNFEKELNKISVKDIQSAAKIFFNGKNSYTAILNPEVQTEKK